MQRSPRRRSQTRRSFSRSRFAGLFLFVVTLPPALAAAGEDAAALDLLRAAAATLAEAPSSAVTMRIETRLDRDGKIDEQADEFRFSTAPGGRYEFAEINADGEPARRSLRVVGDDRVRVTQVVGLKRHTLDAAERGFADHIDSPAGMRIGGGLGRLGLALLSPASTEDLIANLTHSEVVGEAIEGEETLTHARFTIDGRLDWEAWFAADGSARRITPDAVGMPSVQRMADRYATFAYDVAITFPEWNTGAGLATTDLPIAEPDGSMAIVSLYQPPPQPPYSLLGAKAPEFRLDTPGGDTVELADLRNENVVLLEFWSTSCRFCVEAMPELEAIHDRLAERGLAYYAINVGEAADDVAAFLEARGVDAPTLIDDNAEATTAYNVGPIPLILLVGKDGEVQFAQEGYAAGSEEAIEHAAERLLEGEDLAGEQIDAWRERQQRLADERERLRGLLDG